MTERATHTLRNGSWPRTGKILMAAGYLAPSCVDDVAWAQAAKAYPVGPQSLHAYFVAGFRAGWRSDCIPLYEHDGDAEERATRVGLAAGEDFRAQWTRIKQCPDAPIDPRPVWERTAVLTDGRA